MFTSVILWVPFVVGPDGMDGFEELQKKRAALQKHFEESESQRALPQPNDHKDHQVEPAEKTKDPITPSLRERMNRLPKSAEPLSAPDLELRKEKPKGIGRYMRSLSNAYGCFKIYLSGLFQARFRRDTTVQNECLHTTDLACDNKTAQILDKQVLSLKDQFNLCLEKD